MSVLRPLPARPWPPPTTRTADARPVEPDPSSPTHRRGRAVEGDGRAPVARSTPPAPPCAPSRGRGDRRALDPEPEPSTGEGEPSTSAGARWRGMGAHPSTPRPRPRAPRPRRGSDRDRYLTGEGGPCLNSTPTVPPGPQTERLHHSHDQQEQQQDQQEEPALDPRAAHAHAPRVPGRRGSRRPPHVLVAGCPGPGDG